MSNKVILAYSGSLETSVAIHWLRHRLGYEVITYSADIGGGEELSRLGDQAVEIGAVAAHISDLKKRFIQEYAIPALKARARYQSGYLLAAALSRPLIVSELVKLAVEEGVTLVAHASSPRGNDQVRFQTSVAALSPDLQVIHPPRLWSYCEMGLRAAGLAMADLRGDLDYAEGGIVTFLNDASASGASFFI